VTLILHDRITRFAECAHKALELLSEFSGGQLTPDDPNYHSIEYISWLNRIEKQLSSIRGELQRHGSPHDLENQSESVAVKELFVLATLLYLERKSTQLVGPSSKTDGWVEDAFLILSRVEHCNKPFPLFIFGREARTDSRRLLILRIIDWTMKKANARSLASLREMLVKLWVQDDLNVEGNADDQRNACFLLKFCNFVPCLL